MESGDRVITIVKRHAIDLVIAREKNKVDSGRYDREFGRKQRLHSLRFSRDLGILWIGLGFGDFAKYSRDFYLH